VRRGKGGNVDNWGSGRILGRIRAKSTDIVAGQSLGLVFVTALGAWYAECLYTKRGPQVGVGRREGVRHRAFHHDREISMLVLSRKLGEKIVIGENIVVTVVKIDRNQIRIGIEAPHEVPVYREEISPNRITKAATDEPVFNR
jgi:carbon storage regulator